MSDLLAHSKDNSVEEDIKDNHKNEVITIDQVQYHSKQNNDNTRSITAPPSLRIVPPLNFNPVERYLYRSGQPSTINHSFLKELNLKSIIWLAIEDPQDNFLKFIDENNINFFYNLGFNNIDSNSWDGLSENSIKQALEIMIDKRNYPLLVCCGMGRHRTGTIIGCLRKLQGWNLASVSEEYRRFTGNRGGRILVELLIEAFDVNSIKINRELAPDWLLS